MYKKKFLNYIDNRIIVMEYATSARKRYTQNLKKHPKRPLVVTNKYPENQDVFNPSKRYGRYELFDPKKKKILYIKFYARINLKSVYQKLVFMLNVSVVQKPIKFIIAWFHN